MTKFLLFFVLVGSHFNLLASSGSAVKFPTKFLGVWDGSENKCSKNHSEHRLKIYSGTVEYWESSGELVKLSKVSGDKIEIVLSMSGEGENWSRKSKLEIHDKKLTEHLPDGSSYTRVRCSSNA